MAFRLSARSRRPESTDAHARQPERLAAGQGDASGPASRGSTRLGTWVFALGVVSLVAYYASSLGVRHFLTFAIVTAEKALQALGHGR